MNSTPTQIDELSPGIFRLAAFDPEVGITFNQFLINDDAPALVHTGTYPMYERIRKAVSEIIDPKRLRYIVVPHFEADECGGMRRFVEEAPEAELLCGEVGAMINFSAWEYMGPFRGMRDGSTVELGRHRLRFWETPHVHHWDSMMVMEETTKSLFPADLFLQPGDQPAICRENLGREMCELYQAVGIFGGARPVIDVADRVRNEAPAWIHPMHGGSLPESIIPGYLDALRNHPFTYDGRVFGRVVSGQDPVVT